MNKSVVIVNGADIGKYRFIDELRKTEVFSTFSTVKQAKKVAMQLGWDGKTLDKKSRRLISNIKDAYSDYNNGPIVDIIKDIDSSDTELNIVFCREKKDINQLKEHYDNIKIVLFSRVEDYGEHLDGHADKDIYDYDYDLVLLIFDTDDSIKRNLKMFKSIIKEMM